MVATEPEAKESPSESWVGACVKVFGILQPIAYSGF